MYRYDEFDHRFVAERTAQFREQAQRRLSGELSEDEFRPVAADERPLSPAPCLYAAHRHPLWHAVVAPAATASPTSPRRWDRGYGHFTTRQNIQFNWIKLEDTRRHSRRRLPRSRCMPSRPPATASAMSPPIIGRAPPPTSSPIPGRWRSCCANGRRLHPEFSYLPRKFKIAVTGAPNDRAAVKVHDIGLQHALRTTRASAAGKSSSAAAWAAPRWSASPCATSCRSTSSCPISKRSCASTICYGRRDNKYKARIKILVHELGAEKFKRQVEAEYAAVDRSATPKSTSASLQRIAAYFAPPAFAKLPQLVAAPSRQAKLDNPAFARWVRANVAAHRDRRLCDRQYLAEAGRAASPAMPPPTRCARSPILPSATASTSCG